MQFACSHRRGMVFFANACVVFKKILGFPQACHLRAVGLVAFADVEGANIGWCWEKRDHATRVKGLQWLNLISPFSWNK